MKQLDNRGIAAFEFCLVAAPILILIFAIFDFSRYAITVQSLRMLADAGARAMMINCYTPAVIAGSSPSSCTSSPLSSTAMQSVAPFLFGGTAGSVNLTVSAAGGVLTVKASQPGFAMIMPIWGGALNAPTASTSVPY
ncbi:MAG TPA: TadE/TadG family type IV pilus assembly protein [Acetobacteraceae bacterium]|jgi:Flp pilus assembly protein TadG|nr:TadE/TadG family type IV pilus assembly protein [Acetobacteraceae bacterium]